MLVGFWGTLGYAQFHPSREGLSGDTETMPELARAGSENLWSLDTRLFIKLHAHDRIPSLRFAGRVSMFDKHSCSSFLQFDRQNTCVCDSHIYQNLAYISIVR